MDLRGSRTEQHLMMAFAGESQARNRYTFYADVAREEGFLQIASLFLETAENEREHARVFFGLLGGADVEFTAGYPAGPVGTTLDNLEHAAEGELLEWGTLYPEFARVAEEEGFKKIAAAFRKVAEVEVYHERRYRKLHENVRTGKVFVRDEPTRWKCANCGYVHEGTGAPMVCPTCGLSQEQFEVFTEPY